VVASLVGLVALTVATPAAASSGSEKPPLTFHSQFNTEWILQVQGFLTPNVFYRLGVSQDIVVVYDGGGPADPEEAIRQVEGTVWGLERFRFDRLVIQNGNQPPFVVSYAELEASIGPRQPGFDAGTLRDFAAVGAATSGSGLLLLPFINLLKVVVAVIGVTALLAVLAFGLASYSGTRARLRDETEDRLFA
jgi:hypothetical protein